MSVTGPGSPLPVHKAFGYLSAIAVVSVVLGVIVAGLAVPFAGVLGIGTRNVSDSLDDLPAELQTQALDQKSRIVDADGNLLALLYSESGNRVNVPLSKVSPLMVKAMVSIEDDRFFQHGALDLQGTLRALVINQASGGDVVQGGSSITQQLVKMTLLNQAETAAQRQAASDDSYERKIRELRYAIALEEKRSKHWILERYLNIAFFGDGAYGIQAAARHYFDKNASELDLRESAMLAGLVQSPTSYDPTNYPDRALQRRNVVLSRMTELKAVPPGAALRAERQPLGLDIAANPVGRGCLTSRSPFFCDYVVRYLLQDERLGATEAERRTRLFTGGLTIRTTIDMRFQRAAERAVRDRVFPTDEAIGAMAEVVPGTGEVRALAQSRPMGAKKGQGQTYLNYVVPKEYGDANGFQAGSTFKAFTLAAAINQGVPLNYDIASPDAIELDEEDFEDCGGEPYGYGDWPVTGGGGTYDLYSGTANSVNTFYAQLQRLTGVCEPFRLARDMGVRLTQPRGDDSGYGLERTPSFVLGVPDVSPLEMAEAYATFAARGLHCDSRPVTSIEGPSGKEVYPFPKRCQQVMPTETADAVNDVLQGVLAPGGTADDAALGIPAAGKTGTNQENRAVWFVGYTPKLAGAAMVAGANREGQWRELSGVSIGGVTTYDAFGGVIAAPIWERAMEAVQGEISGGQFFEPGTETIQGKVVSIPDVQGQGLDSAESELASAGFSSAYGGEVPSRLPEGVVAYTVPSDDSAVPTGELITIYTSSGVPPRPVRPPRPNGPNRPGGPGTTPANPNTTGPGNGPGGGGPGPG